MTRWAPTWSRLPVAHRPNEIELYRDDVLMLATKSQETEELVRTRARGPVGGSTAAAQPAGGRAAERPGERAGAPAAPRLSSAPSPEFRRATSNPVRSCPTSDCEAPDPNRVSHPDADSGSMPRPRPQKRAKPANVELTMASARQPTSTPSSSPCSIGTQTYQAEPQGRHPVADRAGHVTARSVRSGHAMRNAKVVKLQDGNGRTCSCSSTAYRPAPRLRGGGASTKDAPPVHSSELTSAVRPMRARRCPC